MPRARLPRIVPRARLPRIVPRARLPRIVPRARLWRDGPDQRAPGPEAGRGPAVTRAGKPRQGRRHRARQPHGAGAPGADRAPHAWPRPTTCPGQTMPLPRGSRPCMARGQWRAPAERGMRPIGLGRRSCLTASSDAGGEPLAHASTLIGTARMGWLLPLPGRHRNARGSRRARTCWRRLPGGREDRGQGPEGACGRDRHRAAPADAAGGPRCRRACAGRGRFEGGAAMQVSGVTPWGGRCRSAGRAGPMSTPRR